MVPGRQLAVQPEQRVVVGVRTGLAKGCFYVHSSHSKSRETPIALN